MPYKDPEARRAYQRQYQREWARRRRRERGISVRAASIADKRKLIEERKRQPCMDCGGTFPPECMDFDHRDPSAKVANVSRLQYSTMENLKAELDKCDLVCSNCHRIRTTRSIRERTLHL